MSSTCTLTVTCALALLSSPHAGVRGSMRAVAHRLHTRAFWRAPSRAVARATFASGARPPMSERHEIIAPAGKPMFAVDPADAVRPGEWDLVCDVRSPAEYAEDHLPGAISCPVLDDAERAEVGTMHKQVSPFESRRRGAAIVSKNLHALLTGPPFDTLDPDARVLVYCWRGGERSCSIGHVLCRIGWDVGVVRGGYKGYRTHVRGALERLSELQYHVIGGSTGSAKGLLLDQLVACGAQVIDLEGLANHKGSILGSNPSSSQPSQKRFESLLLHAASSFDPRRPVFIESESNLVGRLHVPPGMFRQMQAAPRTVLELPMGARVGWIRRSYRYFETTHVDMLRTALSGLTRLQGRERVAGWQQLIDAGRWEELVESLLLHHYDPAYERSAQVFYESSVAAADRMPLPDTSEETYRAAAQRLIAAHDIGADAASGAAQQQQQQPSSSSSAAGTADGAKSSASDESPPPATEQQPVVPARMLGGGQ